MAWVRIHDGAMSHPKLVGLIDWKNPFCVWVWGLSYSQQYLTNGAIPRAAIPNRAALQTTERLLTAGVWERTETGFQIHDYLDWNDSREVVQRKRTEAKERMTNARQRSSREHIANFYVERGVDRRSSSVEGVQGKPLAPDLAAHERLAHRAARLLETYEELFSKHRNGAKFHRKPSLDFQRALGLCETWGDDDRLRKMAEILLTTDEDWVARSDRGFGVFVARATWCDDRLSEWEAQQARKALN